MSLKNPGITTHCLHGHELTPDNVYLDPKKTRRCRTCIRAAKARGRALKRTTVEAGIDIDDLPGLVLALMKRLAS